MGGVCNFLQTPLPQTSLRGQCFPFTQSPAAPAMDAQWQQRLAKMEISLKSVASPLRSASRMPCLAKPPPPPPANEHASVKFMGLAQFRRASEDGEGGGIDDDGELRARMANLLQPIPGATPPSTTQGIVSCLCQTDRVDSQARVPGNDIGADDSATEDESETTLVMGAHDVITGNNQCDDALVAAEPSVVVPEVCAN